MSFDPRDAREANSDRGMSLAWERIAPHAAGWAVATSISQSETTRP